MEGGWMLCHERLRHMHLHDAEGAKNHLPLGKGQVQVGNLLALARGKNLSVVLETKTVAGLRESAEYLRERKLL